MNPFVFACITPHGGEIIKELSSTNPSLMETTRDSMEQLGALMTAADPETIIVLTPHGTRIHGQFSVVNSEHMYGEVEGYLSKVTMDRVVDRDLADAIANTAMDAGLSVAVANFAVTAGPLSRMPLDWGAVIPLYFMPNVPVVVITPSRALSYEEHHRFGTALRATVATYGKRVGLIASCDWSHAHHEQGPYGRHEDAKRLDEKVVELIESGDLEGMMDFDEELIENAKPDGIWQALILAGAILREERHVELLSYEVPSYFGLICAAFHRS